MDGGRRKKTGEKTNLFPRIGPGCAFCLPWAEEGGLFSYGGFVNMRSVFFTQPRKRASPENPCGKFTVFHILHRFFHRRFSTKPQACGEIHAVYIKDLQIDTLFFTFFETGHFDPPRRFVENYPLDSPRAGAALAGLTQPRPSHPAGKAPGTRPWPGGGDVFAAKPADLPTGRAGREIFSKKG